MPVIAELEAARVELSKTTEAAAAAQRQVEELASELEKLHSISNTLFTPGRLTTAQPPARTGRDSSGGFYSGPSMGPAPAPVAAAPVAPVSSAGGQATRVRLKEKRASRGRFVHGAGGAPVSKPVEHATAVPAATAPAVPAPAATPVSPLAPAPPSATGTAAVRRARLKEVRLRGISAEVDGTEQWRHGTGGNLTT